MPKNSNKSIFDLARIYGFYESSNGINVKGKIFGLEKFKEIEVKTDLIHYANTNSFTSKEPALVGDIIITTDEKKLIVIDTVNTFTGDINFAWNVVYKAVAEKDFNYPLDMLREETEQPQYYQKLYDSKDVIKKELLGLIRTISIPLLAIGVDLTIPIKTAEDNIDNALSDEKKASY